jgi:hypothetical protein
MRHRVVGILFVAGLSVSISRTATAQSSSELRTPRSFSSPPLGGRSGDLRAPPGFGSSVPPGHDLRAPPAASGGAPIAAVRAEIVTDLQRACASGAPATGAGFTPPPALLRNDRRGTPTIRPTIDLRRREVQQLEGSIESTPPGDPQRADVLMRVATLSMDLGIEARMDGRAADARADESHAVAPLESLATSYPSYARGDEALFRLAVAREDLGDVTAARRAFLQLVQRYPQSAYVPYTYANFGEYFFARAEGPSAVLCFDRVRMYSSATPLWAFATLRMAQISASQSEWQRARQLFAVAYQWARTSSDAAALPGLDNAATAGFCSVAARGR